jgi:hypothetical protein
MLLAAITLHLLAILVYTVALRQDLLVPMITGTKLLPQSVAAPCIVSPTRAILLIAASAAAAGTLVKCL